MCPVSQILKPIISDRVLAYVVFKSTYTFKLSLKKKRKKKKIHIILHICLCIAFCKCLLNLAGYTQGNVIATHTCGRMLCHLLVSCHLLVFICFMICMIKPILQNCDICFS